MTLSNIVSVGQFANLDKRVVTKNIAILTEAIALDMANGQNRKLKLKTYGDGVHAKMRLSNKSAFRSGTYVGRKIIEGKDLRPTDTLIGGVDFAKISFHVLGNEGLYDWPATRSAIKKMGEPFTELLKIDPLDPHEAMNSVLNDQLSGLTIDTPNIADRLEEIAANIRPIEVQRDILLKRLQTQNLTILNTMTENTDLRDQNDQLREALDAAQIALDRLRRGISNETNPKKKKELEKALKEYEEKFDKITT